MSANSNQTADRSRNGARASRTASGHPIEPPEPDQTDRALIEQRRRRRVQKKQFIARARRVLLGGPPADLA